MVDYLAMVGDASDNIPGIPGVGPKTAVEYLKNFGTMDNLFRNVHNIKQPRKRATLENTVSQVIVRMGWCTRMIGLSYIKYLSLNPLGLSFEEAGDVRTRCSCPFLGFWHPDFEFWWEGATIVSGKARLWGTAFPLSLIHFVNYDLSVLTQSYFLFSGLSPTSQKSA